VPAFSQRDEHVPEVDERLPLQPDVTLAILAGFAQDRRVMVQGLHGTGKSTHIEQVAARLNWPCVRVNLDGHVSRLDLVGRDAVVLRDGQQVTEFQEGIVPWALQRPVALIFDEYDAGRPDVMFVIQRVLERDGKFTLMDQNRVLKPHPGFRLFATANTVGLGNLNGLYHGAQRLNHAQIDRWNIVATLNYLPADEEVAIVLARVPAWPADTGRALVRAWWRGRADAQRLRRRRPEHADVAAHRDHLGREPADLRRRGAGLPLSFGNKCDEAERPVVAEYFQRCFDQRAHPPPDAPERGPGRGPAAAAHRGAVRGGDPRAVGQRDLHFRGRRLHRGRARLPLYAPHLHPVIERDDFASFRGAADGLALRLRLSDDTLHQRCGPARAGAPAGVRAARAVPRRSAGGRAVARRAAQPAHRFERWSLDFHHQRPDRHGPRHPAVHRGADQPLRASRRAGARRHRRPDGSHARRHRARCSAMAWRCCAARATTRRPMRRHALAIADAVAGLLEAADGDAGSDGADAEGGRRSHRLQPHDGPGRRGIEARRRGRRVTGRSRVLDEAASALPIFTTAYDREAAPRR
jgi:cobaltochelatase CobS